MDDPDGVPKQSCFNNYPLDRAGDAADLAYGPVDPDYPGRYFLDPPCRYWHFGTYWRLLRLVRQYTAQDKWESSSYAIFVLST